MRKEYYQNTNEKLNDRSTSSKTYWSIMKTFLNSVKVAAKHSLLFNFTFVTDFQEKASTSNSFFAEQRILISNNSVSPSELTYMTEEHIQ